MERDSALSTVVQPHLEHLEQYEPSSMQVVESGQQAPAPPTVSTSSSQAPLQAANSGGPNVQDLTPVDRGVRAWLFCISSFVLEIMMWGFCFSYGTFQSAHRLQGYYTTHPPFNSASSISIAAVGTVAIAFQYTEVLLISCNFGRWPDYMRIGMWCGLVPYFLSIFCSSFATQVWQLIMLQGVVFGISGGLLYVPPIIQLLPKWFSAWRGFARGVIFAGGGVGGFVFPFALTALLDRVGFRWTLRIWAITYVDDLLWGSPSSPEAHGWPKALASAATQLYFHGQGGQSRGRVHEQEDPACLVNLKLIFGLRERSFVQGPRLCGDDDQSVSVLWPLSYGTSLVRDWK